MAIVKREDKTKPVKKDKKVKPSAKPADDDDDIMDTFGEYNLLEIGVPPNAWPPRNGCYGGKHGYTLKSPGVLFLDSTQTYLQNAIVLLSTV